MWTYNLRTPTFYVPQHEIFPFNKGYFWYSTLNGMKSLFSLKFYSNFDEPSITYILIQKEYIDEKGTWVRRELCTSVFSTQAYQVWTLPLHKIESLKPGHNQELEQRYMIAILFLVNISLLQSWTFILSVFFLSKTSI